MLLVATVSRFIFITLYTKSLDTDKNNNIDSFQSFSLISGACDIMI